jgi:ATP-dependent Lon protease
VDRFEIIQFPGYSEREKMEIAANYILPKLQQEYGLTKVNIEIPQDVLVFIIREYTREAGLRNLERELAALCRRVARVIVSQYESLQVNESGDSKPTISFDVEKVREFLGPPRFQHEKVGATNRVGVTTGLVWTENGGEIVFVETTKMHGTGQLILTGLLGKILKESAQTALSYLRSRAHQFGIEPASFTNLDIHIHIPSGAIPKDGPSAGITIFFALLSLFLNRPARRDVALTGELTLTGRILPVEGVREKLLAAQRAGIKTVILP